MFIDDLNFIYKSQTSEILEAFKKDLSEDFQEWTNGDLVRCIDTAKGEFKGLVAYDRYNEQYQPSNLPNIQQTLHSMPAINASHIAMLGPHSECLSHIDSTSLGRNPRLEINVLLGVTESPMKIVLGDTTKELPHNKLVMFNGGEHEHSAYNDLDSWSIAIILYTDVSGFTRK